MAKKNKVVQWCFRLVQRRMLRKTFRVLDVAAVRPDGPVILIVNHSNFFDSLVLFELEQRGFLPGNIVAVMGADGLSKHRIFRGLGVVPVSTPMKLSEYKEMVRLMNEASLLLFPQGKEEHQEKRPLSIEKGVVGLLSKQRAHGILNVSFYYSFGATSKGEIACRMRYVPAGERPVNGEGLQQFITQSMTEELDELKGHVVEQKLTAYERLCL